MADLGILGQTLDGGTLNTLAPNASQEDIVASLNDIIRRLNVMLKTQIFADEENKRYVQGYSQGRWPGGDFGIAISKPGENVLDVEFEDLLFAWDFSTNDQYFNGGVVRYIDPNNDKNYMQIGILPDGSGGEVIAKPGVNVEDVFN